MTEEQKKWFNKFLDLREKIFDQGNSEKKRAIKEIGLFKITQKNLKYKQETTMNEVKTFEFEGKSYKIIKPTNKIRRESDSIYAKAYREAIANGMYLEAEIEKILKERNLDKYSVEEQKGKREKN